MGHTHHNELANRRGRSEGPPGFSIAAVDGHGVTSAGTAVVRAKVRQAEGSDADRVGTWPERGMFDTQLGPNRNGRKW